MSKFNEDEFIYRGHSYVAYGMGQEMVLRTQHDGDKYDIRKKTPDSKWVISKNGKPISKITGDYEDYELVLDKITEKYFTSIKDLVQDAFRLPFNKASGKSKRIGTPKSYNEPENLKAWYDYDAVREKAEEGRRKSGHKLPVKEEFNFDGSFSNIDFGFDGWNPEDISLYNSINWEDTYDYDCGDECAFIGNLFIGSDEPPINVVFHKFIPQDIEELPYYAPVEFCNEINNNCDFDLAEFNNTYSDDGYEVLDSIPEVFGQGYYDFEDINSNYFDFSDDSIVEALSKLDSYMFKNDIDQQSLRSLYEAEEYTLTSKDKQDIINYLRTPGEKDTDSIEALLTAKELQNESLRPSERSRLV